MLALISVGELAACLDEPALVVLDVRWRLGGPHGRAEYDAGHLPAAHFVDLETDLARPADEHGRHPLPSSGEFQQAMRRCGIHKDSLVVCYDGADSTAAARVWWLLRYFGHAAVRVLDGGYAAWVASGGVTTVDQPAPADTGFVARPGHLAVLTATGAAAVARSGALLDARATERYTGRSEPVDPVAGHIPGAISAPTTDNVDADGRFLGVDELRRRFAGLGVSLEVPTAAYCGSGIAAAHQVLALQVAGFDAGLYADSWSGWITDPSRPVATGDDSS
ncbi:MAG: sulfurtransferase [Nocardioidaceae bacterium]